ncbi:MAG: hypothetical protein JWL86_6559 [Rhizobium sp.]|nr:hypothetical protein [Rhizobium sp.]
MHSARNPGLPMTTARLAFVYHLISRGLGKHHPSKQQATNGHSLYSAVLIVGFMTVGTIFVISLLQLLLAAVN